MDIKKNIPFLEYPNLSGYCGFGMI